MPPKPPDPPQGDDAATLLDSYQAARTALFDYINRGADDIEDYRSFSWNGNASNPYWDWNGNAWSGGPLYVHSSLNIDTLTFCHVRGQGGQNLWLVFDDANIESH